jgi:hypothetical protein
MASKKITAAGWVVLDAVAAVESRGGVYRAGGQSRRAATAKLVRDGYLAVLAEGGYTLTDLGRQWAKASSEAISARPEVQIGGLTKAQRNSLAAVAAGQVTYQPGRTGGASSNWTRYSYSALVGGRFVRRTKSVDALVTAGLADVAGSTASSAPVVLTAAGRELLGVESTPLVAIRVKVGRRVIAADGTMNARVADVASTAATVTLHLADGQRRWTEAYPALSPVAVLS